MAGVTIRTATPDRAGVVQLESSLNHSPEESEGMTSRLPVGGLGARARA